MIHLMCKIRDEIKSPSKYARHFDKAHLQDGPIIPEVWQQYRRKRRSRTVISKVHAPDRYRIH